MPVVTVVVPLWNEVDQVDPLIERLRGVLESLDVSWEVILVDDGSGDGTWEALVRHRAREGRLRLIRLKRNYGQHAALCAGLDVARGQYVVVMDADLQVAPEHLGRMLDAFEEGADVVTLWRQHRPGTPRLRRWASWCMNAVLRSVTGAPLHDFTGGMRGMRREIAREIQHHGPRRRFLAALIPSLGQKVVELPIDELPASRPSRYNAFRLFGLVVDFVTSFSERPFQGILMAGVAMTLSGGLLGALYLAGRLAALLPPSDHVVLLSMLAFFTGLQFVVLGLMGEYNIRSLTLLMGHPLYEAAERLGFDEEQDERSGSRTGDHH